MHAAQHQAAADTLLAAYTSRVPVAPLVETYPDLDLLVDAYRIQAMQIGSWERAGRSVVGRKIGLTSPAMQRQMGVTQPDHGVLRDDMVLADRAAVPMRGFIAPWVEPEIAMVLGRDLTGPVFTVAAAAAAAYVLPSLEIIDSRIADWRISIGDTIADNASSGAAVLGDSPVRLRDQDLRLVGCNLHRNGEVVATGAGGAVFGNPLRSLAWLANTLAAFGASLSAGQVLLPGSLTAAQPVAAGHGWTATFAGIGTVTARFVEEDA